MVQPGANQIPTPQMSAFSLYFSIAVALLSALLLYSLLPGKTRQSSFLGRVVNTERVIILS